jgi:hypothetical protein
MVFMALSTHKKKIILLAHSLQDVKMKLLAHVMRNVNEFNIPAGESHGYEIMYFGVNLILMLDYGLSFDIEVKNSQGIEVLIISRKDVPLWKKINSDIKAYYNNSGVKINDVFRPTISDAYAFILTNRSSNEVKTVEVTLIHNWQQEVKESQLKERRITSNLT